MKQRAISRGKIRVDARRALSKLREHLLVDPHLYLSELTRGAVACGATQVAVVADADDVILSWCGPVPSVTRVSRLFDYLLSEAASPQERRLRLLALGVNAALGLSPRFVDVCLGDGARWQRVRFSSAQLRADLDAPAPLPEVREVPTPRAAFETGATIHVRKRPGFGVLKRALVGGEHAEISMLRDRIRDLPIPIELPVAVPAPAPALVRVEFTLPRARRAFVELCAAGSPASLDVLEQGVRLIHDHWRPLPAAPDAAIGVPARLLVDGEALPTNASRSALREDTAFVREMLDGASGALFRALDAAAQAVAGASEVPEGVELLGNRDAIEDALGAVVCVVAQASRRGMAVDAQAEKLLELELLRDATGRRRSVLEFLTLPRVAVLRGDHPVAPELGMWMKDVLRLSGRVVEHALSGVELLDGEDVLERAKRGAQRWQKWMEHAPSGPRVPSSEDELVRAEVRGSEAACPGLVGEIVVRDPEIAPHASVLRVFLQDRPLESLRLDRSVLPLPVDAALAWDERLRPTFEFDAVERTDELAEGVAFVLAQAVRVVADRARALSDTAAGRRVARAAFSTLARAPAALNVEFLPGFEQPSTAAPELWRARIWEATEPKRWLSVDQLARWAAPRTALCFVSPGSGGTGRAADGRPVVLAEERELSDIRALLGGKIDLVPYERALGVSEGQRRARVRQVLDEELRQAGLSDVPRLEFEQNDGFGIVAVARAGRVVEMHAGVVLSRLPRRHLLGTTLTVVDDGQLVPRADWSGVCHRPARFRLKIQLELCQTLVDALQGDEAAREKLLPQSVSQLDTPLVRSHLLAAAAELRERTEQAEKRGRSGRWEDANKALYERLSTLALVARLNEHGKPVPTPLAELVAHSSEESPLYCLRSAPGFETLDARPVVLPTAEEYDAFLRLVPDAVDGFDKLGEWRERAALEKERRRLLERPELSPTEVGQLADPTSPVIRTELGANEGGPATAALALPVAAAPADSIEITHAHRLVCRVSAPDLGLPLCARVELPEDAHIEDFTTLSEAGLAVVRAVLTKGALDLARSLVAGPAPWLEAARVTALLAALCRFQQVSEIAKMVASAEFPTVQGNTVGLERLVRPNQEIWGATQRFDDWPAGGRTSDLDSPVLFFSPGHAREWSELLIALGYSLRDVGDALDKLRAWRQSDQRQPVELPGAPSHPSLRRSLTELGINIAEGELEIVEGPGSEVTLVELDGTPRSVKAELNLPLRVILRWDSLGGSSETDKTLLVAVVRAAWRYLMSLAAHFDELPPWVRGHVRAYLCRRVARGKKLSAEERGMPVFVDIRGQYHSLLDLGPDAWRYTELDPPYPQRRYRYPVLRLEADEAKALSQLSVMKDVHSMLVGDLRGEERSRAPVVEHVGLTAEQRSRCMQVVPFSAGSAEGELGVIHPRYYGDASGIELLVGRRPLCTLEPELPWPVVAVINDDEVVPNRWFSKPAKQGQAAAIEQQVRHATRRVMRELLSPPEGTLGVAWLDGQETSSGLRLTGSLWLPRRWPQAPLVQLALPGAAHVLEGALTVGRASLTDGVVPVEGRLLIAPPATGESAIAISIAEATGVALLPGNVMDELGAVALRHAVALAKDVTTPAEYGWDLALLDEDTAIETRSVDGRPFDPAALRAELSQGGVWYTRGEGSAEGDFPEHFVGRILRHDDPLVRVLAARKPRSLHEMGGARRRAPLDAPPPAVVPRPSVASAPGTPPTQSLYNELSRLELAGSPVHSVELDERGRALRYRRGKVFVNGRTAGPLLERAHRDRGALMVLVAAAVSEINRELGPVTDAEERRALLELLAAL